MNIDYFAYYSVGGYKDMFLGSYQTKEETVYYSPFYSLWKSDGLSKEWSDQMKEQMEYLDTQKMITIVNSTNNEVMSDEALRFFMYSGFKLACCTLGNGKTTVVLGDLCGEQKDDNSRNIPFMLQLIGDDKKTMVALADYIRVHLHNDESFFAELFEYNASYNCIQFNIGKLNEWIGTVIEEKIDVESVEASTRKLHRLVIFDGMAEGEVLDNLNMTKRDVDLITYLAGGVVYNSKNDNSETNRGMETSHEVENYSARIMDGIKKALGVFKLYPEDKEDLVAINSHIKKIIGRHF